MNLRYAVVITIENGVEYETRIPKNWIIGDKFYCPRSMKVNVLDPENPVIGEWLEFSYVMLKEDLSDDENANKENFDNEFRNTESDCENERRKLLKRKHSVSSLVTGSESDVNDGSKTIHIFLDLA
ncbi:hypothetical protein Bhyg_08473 [Pseudolycoriella hygida]|uniref:Uncharacterized protein n=1 Tax=Pseudolycoriella hygida TaxID=35572 RepID=A0A9Q0N5R2_9DIPT|nr:hypothetical protein Bhyg_08473 [Pseudolycoriella hygida]